MPADTLTQAAPRSASQDPSRLLPLPLRLAMRELRGGLSGFYVFLACIALAAPIASSTVGNVAMTSSPIVLITVPLN